MAAGEYVSVSSQADSERADTARERRELQDDPLLKATLRVTFWGALAMGVKAAIGAAFGTRTSFGSTAAPREIARLLPYLATVMKPLSIMVCSRRAPHTVRFAIAVLTACFALVPMVPVAAGIPAGERVDGISCDAAEGVQMHIHSHLSVLDHGKPVGVPEDVGRPLAAQCFYWLHTHTPDGIIHIESPKYRDFTLGEFFDIWGQPLRRDDVAGARPRPGETVKVYVDGHPYAGDPRKIALAQHLDVVIIVGKPYAQPRPFNAWNGN